MPSKFGEFRYLGGKPGVKSKVTFQAQVKNTSGQWSATTKQTACQQANQWIEEGFPFIVKDGGSWNAQDWNTSAHKRVLVRVQENTGGDIGIFVTQEDAHNQDVVGACLTITSAGNYGYCMPDASQAVMEQLSNPAQWNTEGCTFLPDPS